MDDVYFAALGTDRMNIPSVRLVCCRGDLVNIPAGYIRDMSDVRGTVHR